MTAFPCMGNSDLEAVKISSHPSYGHNNTLWSWARSWKMTDTLGSSMSDIIPGSLLLAVSHHLQSVSALRLKFPSTPCCSNYWVTTDFSRWTFARCISSKLQSFALVLSLINSTHIIMGISVSQYFLHPKNLKSISKSISI